MREDYAVRGRVDDDCDRCHYCDLPFGRTRHDHDHAPVPRSSGGRSVVAACQTCHDMKDRGGLRGLPAAEYARAVLALSESGALAHVLKSPPVEWPDGWGEMNRWERIVWARAAMLHHQGGDWHAATVRRIAMRDDSAA